MYNVILAEERERKRGEGRGKKGDRRREKGENLF